MLNAKGFIIKPQYMLLNILQLISGIVTTNNLQILLLPVYLRSKNLYYRAVSVLNL